MTRKNKEEQEKDLCGECNGLAFTMQVKRCERCKKSSDEDSRTLHFCTACAKKTNCCRGCGEKL